MLDILSVLLHTSERVPTQSSQLQHHDLPFRGHALINIRLLADSYLSEYILDQSPLEKCMKRKVIIPKVGKLIPIAFVTNMRDELVLQ